MYDNDNDQNEQFGSIRRLIRSEANARYLRRLPMFRVEQELPADLRSLLQALDRREPKVGAERG